MDEVYADLETIDLGNQVQMLESKNEDLEKDINKLCKVITEMKSVQENLATNISELYKTAKREIERKDRVIADLRREIDNTLFRRNSKENVPRQGRRDRSPEESRPQKRSKYDDKSRHHSKSDDRHRSHRDSDRYYSSKSDSRKYSDRYDDKKSGKDKTEWSNNESDRHSKRPEDKKDCSKNKDNNESKTRYRSSLSRESTESKKMSSNPQSKNVTDTKINNQAPDKKVKVNIDIDKKLSNLFEEPVGDKKNVDNKSNSKVIKHDIKNVVKNVSKSELFVKKVSKSKEIGRNLENKFESIEKGGCNKQGAQSVVKSMVQLDNVPEKNNKNLETTKESMKNLEKDSIIKENCNKQDDQSIVNNMDKIDKPEKPPSNQNNPPISDVSKEITHNLDINIIASSKITQKIDGKSAIPIDTDSKTENNKKQENINEPFQKIEPPQKPKAKEKDNIPDEPIAKKEKKEEKPPYTFENILSQQQSKSITATATEEAVASITIEETSKKQEIPELPSLHLTHDGEIPVLHLDENNFTPSRYKENINDRNIISLINAMDVSGNNLECEIDKDKHSKGEIFDEKQSETVSDNRMPLNFSNCLNRICSTPEIESRVEVDKTSENSFDSLNISVVNKIVSVPQDTNNSLGSINSTNTSLNSTSRKRRRCIMKMND